MGILWCRGKWEWSVVCDCLLSIAAACKMRPHYICFAARIADGHLYDLDKLIRDLGLEDHFEVIDTSIEGLDAHGAELRNLGKETDWLSQLPS